MGYKSGGDTYANLAKYTNSWAIWKEQNYCLWAHQYPGSQSILVALINIYLESNDDPNKVLDFIHVPRKTNREIRACIMQKATY